MTISFCGPELTDVDLSKIVRLVYDNSGIRLHEGKRALVTARLQKRVRQGGFTSFREYVRHVQNDASGQELTALIDAIATNHTSLFREPQHFHFLRQVVLPPLVERRGLITGWSAACSTGEEPYSIAMTIAESIGVEGLTRFRLVASDLSTKALRIAEAGIYKAERIAAMPHDSRGRYFETGTGARRGLVRVVPSLQRVVEFRQENLLDLPPDGGSFDFVFCRNVMIYFDQPAQQRVVDALERRLATGGYLFISHAESLSAVRHGLTWVASAVYRKVAR
ncbi:MAG TPA: protein-glutamate O-methyltransferase CheR [Vicinamibacterales bacterium]|nr:protein-glutamate O-methyltransferase CheR [Vicinamibacterales bacterium]